MDGGLVWCPGARARFGMRAVHASRWVGPGEVGDVASHAELRLLGDALLRAEGESFVVDLPDLALELSGRSLLRVDGGSARLTEVHHRRVARAHEPCGRFELDAHVTEVDRERLPGLVDEDGRVRVTLLCDAYEENERNPSHRTGRVAVILEPLADRATSRHVLRPVGGAAVASGAVSVHDRGASVSFGLSTALQLQYAGGPLDDFAEIELCVLSATGETVRLGRSIWVDGETYATSADVFWRDVPSDLRADALAGRFAVCLTDGTTLLTTAPEVDAHAC